MTFQRFQIHELENGHFEVLEMAPISLGVLTSRRIAERFIDYLNLLDDTGQGLVDGPADDGEPEAVLADTDLGDDDHQVDGGFCMPATGIAAVVDLGDDDAPAALNETVQDEAFRRLEAGEKLGAVADDLRMSMPRLRAQWAAYVKNRPTPIIPTKTDISVIGDQVECRMCGRDHKVTVTSDGLCARCSREVGGM